MHTAAAGLNDHHAWREAATTKCPTSVFFSNVNDPVKKEITASHEFAVQAK